MLSLLHIENLAVIERADLTFEPGLNLLTGETGAGKSMVIDALGAAMGGRASRELIRSGTQKAAVTALFSPVPRSAEEMLADMGVEDREELLVSREMFSDGRNVCRLNGKPATVSQLRTLGALLVQIHEQQDTQSLLTEERHLPLLDGFAGTDTAACAELYSRVCEIKREISSLRVDADEKARRIDTLNYRIEELDAAEVTAGEEEELLAASRRLKYAQRIAQALDNACGALLGYEDSAGACELICEAADAAAQAMEYGGVSEELCERLESLRYEASDIAELIRACAGELERDRWDANELESRLDLIYRLKSKYSVTADELAPLAERWRAELLAIETSDERLLVLESELATTSAALAKASAALTAFRTAAARELEKRVVSELADLDMGRVRFEIERTEKEPSRDGADNVRFLLAANPGEPLKPLSKTASGGELARIMLALKNVLAEGDEAGTLIFDEVDSGVSGRAAQRVAEKLAGVSRNRQVICVTHLAQIAAMADAHFHISKSIQIEAGEERTVTNIEHMDDDCRARELARITGGSVITEAALENARELIAAARVYKKNINPERNDV